MVVGGVVTMAWKKIVHGKEATIGLGEDQGGHIIRRIVMRSAWHVHSVPKCVVWGAEYEKTEYNKYESREVRSRIVQVRTE